MAIEGGRAVSLPPRSAGNDESAEPLVVVSATGLKTLARVPLPCEGELGVFDAFVSPEGRRLIVRCNPPPAKDKKAPLPASTAMIVDLDLLGQPRTVPLGGHFRS